MTMSAWSVDLRIHSALKLPQSDPHVAVKISSPDDSQCKWSSSARTSCVGTAYIGAWTTIIVRGSDALKLELVEVAPLLDCFRVGLLSASKTLDLRELADEAAEGDEMIKLMLDLDNSTGGKRITEALDATLERAGNAAGKIDGAVGDVIAKHSTTGKGTASTSTETVEDGVIISDHHHQQQQQTSVAGIFTSTSIELRISIRVVPLDRWSRLSGSFEMNGGALEQSVTPLPPGLHSYAHGGFMGLACSVLSDPLWSVILKEESPVAWTALFREQLKLKAMGKSDRPAVAQGKYMMVLENSPVMCAYGLVRTGSTAQASSVDGDTVVVTELPPLPRKAPQLASTVVSFGKQTDVAVEALSAPPAAQTMTVDSSLNTTPLDNEKAAAVAAVMVKEERKNVVAALARYQEAMKIPNMYGYKPLAMEWDIWVSPNDPADLNDATINHGTKRALVTQAVLTSAPGLKSCARRAGANQIGDQGMPPMQWLTQLGHSINRAVKGDKNIPLPVHTTAEEIDGEQGKQEEESYWRLHVGVEKISGVNSQHWYSVTVQADVDSNDVVLQEQRSSPIIVATSTITSSSNSSTSGTPSTAELSFWPLPKMLEHDDLLVMLRGNPVGMVRDRKIGSARLRFETLEVEHPELLSGEEVVVDVELGPWETNSRLRLNVERSTGGGGGGGGISRGDEVIEQVDEMIHSVFPSRTAQNDQSTIAPHRYTVSLRLRLESVGVISAMVDQLGVPRAAAQTAVAMLSLPGGLYLDVKSAYSTAYDMQVFVSTLRGFGITTKAVCSFKPEQLRVGPIADSVLFFHGLSGVENACDSGGVAPGQFVLFNGASFLADIQPAKFESMPASAVEKVLGDAETWPLDAMALRKYQSLCEEYGIVGGFYVQEPDTAPSGVDSLCKLVENNAADFPLGFAYGHLSGRAVGFLDAKGRGFASQQIVEELSSRKDLAGKTIKRIKHGEHCSASLSVQIVWAGRLLHGEDWMAVSEQQAFCTLLADVQPDDAATELVDGVGGIEVIAARYHQHYELTTPLTILEAGFNRNYSKSLFRLLRNRGVMAKLTMSRKLEVAAFLSGPSMRGYGATYLAQASGLRRGLHKHAKEGLLCLLESCTAEEVASIVAALGGDAAVALKLRGLLRLSWHYNQRLRDITEMHAVDANQLAYTNTALKYAALPYDPAPAAADGFFTTTATIRLRDATHTRDKNALEQTWRAVRKSSCCILTTAYTLFLEIITFGVFIPFCVLPRVCGTALKGACGLPAVVAALLGVILALATMIVLTALLHGDSELVIDE